MKERPPRNCRAERFYRWRYGLPSHDLTFKRSEDTAPGDRLGKLIFCYGCPRVIFHTQPWTWSVPSLQPGPWCPFRRNSLVQRIQLADEVREFLCDRSNMPHKIMVGHEEYTLDRPAGSGFKAVVWKVINRYGRPRALKLAILEDYQERSFLEEVQRALELESYEVFARLHHADIVDLPVPANETLRFVGFVEDWVDGFTLKEFLDRADGDISSSFLVSYIAALTSALSAL